MNRVTPWNMEGCTIVIQELQYHFKGSVPGYNPYVLTSLSSPILSPWAVTPCFLLIIPPSLTQRPSIPILSQI